VAEQKLIFGGKQLLHGEKSLENYHIGGNQTLLLIQQTNFAKSIRICIKTITGGYSIEFSVLLMDSIQKVKNLLKEKYPVPKKFYLAFNGIIMEEEKTLHDYGIHDRSTIYVVAKVVVEIEQPTGEKVKVKVTDKMVAGEIIEKIIEEQQNPDTANLKRSHERMTSQTPLTSSSLETTCTTSTSISASSTNLFSRRPRTMFSGLRRGFFLKQSTSMAKTCDQKLQEDTPDFVNSTSQTLIPCETLIPSAEIETDDDTSLCETASKRMKLPDSRCQQCSKKVGLTAIKCRCGSIFCGTHRYPEEHACTFDFKGLARHELSKQNPVIKAEKVSKIN